MLDNGSLGSAEIYYSQNGGQNFTFVGDTLAEIGTFTFTVPFELLQSLS